MRAYAGLARSRALRALRKPLPCPLPLPLSLCRLYSHYDEAFSSLQWPHHKALLRAHVTPGGALEIYSLVLDTVPHSWAEDPRWRTPLGGGCRDRAAHRAKHPSRRAEQAGTHRAASFNVCAAP